jgi:bifunctional non-homologous end joining protein LigD
MPAILHKLKKLEIKSSPFINKVLDTKGATMHWVKPELVANFEFATWTNTGRIRKPATFLGFRKDKKAKDVVREVPKPVEKIEDEIHEDSQRSNKKNAKATRAAKTNEDSNWKELDKIEITSKEEFDIGDCSVTITNFERNIWKDISKASLIQYYHAIAPHILPYLKDRPLSLHIKPYGAMAPGLYIKDMEGREPDCATVFHDKRKHPKPGKRNTIDYLVCNNEATLLYLINLGCIDVNPWMSRIQNPEQPDLINIDLDPSDDDFEKVIEVAQAAKKVLTKYKLISFIKTSGKTGLHIYIPITGIDFAAARNYSEKLGAEIHELIPGISTTQVSISLRGDKVFIDPSQNDYADTLAAPYSARPNRIPTVSTPLDWKEVRPGLDPSQFTIDTMMARINKKGDLFKGVLDKTNQNKNSKAIKKIFG